MKKTALLYSGAIWQLIRFVGISVFLVVYLEPQPDIGSSLFLIWLGAAQLAVVAGFFFYGRDTVRYASYRNLLILGKILDFIPGVFLLGTQALALFFGVTDPIIDFSTAIEGLIAAPVRTALLLYYSLSVVVLLDLIFLIVLLSFRSSLDRDNPAKQSSLPEMSEIRLEDE